VSAQTQSPPASEKVLIWDIFCQVIDNYGDVGVCWRLAAQLALRGHSVRLWLDDQGPLQWMAPGAAQGGWPGISVRDWPSAHDAAPGPEFPLADVWIEAFGCDIPAAWLQSQLDAANTLGRHPAWINLEYLSAEPFALRSHGLPSPVLQGPAKGWTKYFFYPGFSPASGGLLVRNDAPAAQAPTWADPAVAEFAPDASGERTVLLFFYASAPIAALLQALIASGQAVQLLVAAGQSAQAVRDAMAALPDGRRGQLRLRFLPSLPQAVFDQLLALCDLNLVRGEDSLAQAVQAGKPCVWQIYPQDDGAHQPKLQAYLQALAADTPLRTWHAFWNDPPTSSPAPHALAWPWEANSAWPRHAANVAAQLAQNTDLCSQLIDWAVLRAAHPAAQ
jgi:uncharacterized repeat protein (TIGR03837 family)